MELLIGILGAGIGSGIMTLIHSALQRRWAKKDKRDARKDSQDTRLDALVDAQKVIMVHTVKTLGNQYIKDRQIHLDDKDTLKEMYAAYKGLKGNGHLDTVMHEIERLPVVEN